MVGGLALWSTSVTAAVTEPQLSPPATFQKMACHGEHTYLFAQAMMSVLAQEEQGGSAVRRIAQEVQRFAQEK